MMSLTDDFSAIDRTCLIDTEPRLDTLFVKYMLASELDYFLFFWELVTADNTLV
jgi:hypothetical protein